MKHFLKFVLLMLAIFIYSCSIEQGDIPKDGEDGKDGRASLVRLEPTDDGIIVHTGIDLNGNGVLDANEIIDSQLVNHGQDGQDGQDGEDGYTSLIKTQSTDDGFILFFGLDLNRNGVLDEDEITSQITLNHGQDGKDGENGFNTLISIVEITEEMESECEEGIRIYYGLDLDRDNILDDEEMTSYQDICKCECECPDIPYYEIEWICCDDYVDSVARPNVPCEITGLKITKGIVGYPELEEVEIICF